MKIGKTRTFQGLGHKGKDENRLTSLGILFSSAQGPGY